MAIILYIGGVFFLYKALTLVHDGIKVLGIGSFVAGLGLVGWGIYLDSIFWSELVVRLAMLR